MAENRMNNRGDNREVPENGNAGHETDGEFRLHAAMRGLRHKLFLARGALLWERLWRALWPGTGILGILLALALFDLLPALPAWLHWAVLAVLVSGTAFALWRGLRGLTLPRGTEAGRRLESDSGLSHRPLALLDESLASGANDPETRKLWALHRLRAIRDIQAVRLRLPSPGLAARDPLALRGALTVILVLAVTVSWGDGMNRLARALTPGLDGFSSPPPTVDVWITPPAYTGRAPVYLNSQGGDGTDGDRSVHAEGGIEIPEGATVLAQVAGKGKAPRLVFGGREVAFEQMADESWKLETALAPGAGAGELSIRDGRRRLADWPVRILPDHPPTVAFAEPPDTSARGALRIRMEATDDYGIAKATLLLRRARLSALGPDPDPDTDGTPEGGIQPIQDSSGPREPARQPADADSAEDRAALAALNAPREIPLPLPATGTRAVDEISFHDLIADPWAGTEVHAQIVVLDGAGQAAVTETLRIVLPERAFRHPVARALVVLRKQLMQNPARRPDIVDHLHNLSAIPEAFSHDTVVFLAIRSMAHRLALAPGLAVLSEVEKLMWDTALRLEDGALSLVERRLRELQERLQDALRGDADNAEISELLRELERTMAEFLNELMRGMRDQPQMAQPFDPDARTITPQDLQQMLDRARELARTGNSEAARQMLSMLREMLENLRSGRMAEGGDPRQQEAGEMMREMQELMRRQQELMDETFQRSQRGPGEPEAHREGADEQNRLREQLGDMLRRFGEMTGQMPENLGDAELAMREALDALRREQPGEAVDPQGRALESLRQGLGEMAQQFMRQFGQGRQPGQQMGQGTGRGAGQGRGFGGPFPGRPFMALDPLGRPIPNSGQAAGDDVQIPDAGATQRAWEILKELRRRAGEPNRPDIELEYLERLLRQF